MLRPLRLYDVSRIALGLVFWVPEPNLGASRLDHFLDLFTPPKQLLYELFGA